MAKIKDAQEVEDLVCSYYSSFTDSKPYNFQIYELDDMWVVIYGFLGEADMEEHEWRINKNTGLVDKIR
jgi:hypothetical protein